MIATTTTTVNLQVTPTQARILYALVKAHHDSQPINAAAITDLLDVIGLASRVAERRPYQTWGVERGITPERYRHQLGACDRRAMRRSERTGRGYRDCLQALRNQVVDAMCRMSDREDRTLPSKLDPYQEAWARLCKITNVFDELIVRAGGQV